jgi:hypothetical protein
MDKIRKECAGQKDKPPDNLGEKLAVAAQAMLDVDDIPDRILASIRSADGLGW